MAANPEAAPAPASRTLSGSRKNGSRSTPLLSTCEPISRKASKPPSEQPSNTRLSKPKFFFMDLALNTEVP